MADTLIDLINDIFVDVGRNNNKTAIAAIDQTLYIANRINEALQKLYTLEPFEIDTAGTITITPSTRTFSGPAGVNLRNIHPWSLRINNAAGDIPLELVTEEYIMATYPRFESDEADTPRYIYFTTGLVGVYPLLTAGAANLTLQFLYSGQFTELTSPSATFPFKDWSDEMQFIKAYAKAAYELFKGLGNPDVTLQMERDAWNRIYARYAKSRRIGFSPARRMGR